MPGIKGQRSGGRNAKPRVLHIVEGTYQAHRHDRPEVSVPAGEPAVPAGLAGPALEEWRRLVGLLREQNTLSVVDGVALENHCRLHALAVRLEGEAAALETLCFVRTSVDGAGVEHREPRVHPIVGQLRAYRMALRQHLQEFGLTPASRTRVTPAAAPVVNPLDKFIHRKQR